MHRQAHIFRPLGRAVRHLDLRRHPELGLFPSEQQSRKAMRRAARKLIRRPTFLITVVAMAGLSITLTLVLRKAAASLGLPIGQLTRNLILAIPVISVCCTLGLWVLNRHLSKLLRRELLDCGVPTCIRCGYHLIGLTAPVCPECGRPFDEQVHRILDADPSPPVPD